jgi:hypothetical protein
MLTMPTRGGAQKNSRSGNIKSLIGGVHDALARKRMLQSIGEQAGKQRKRAKASFVYLSCLQRLPYCQNTAKIE